MDERLGHPARAGSGRFRRTVISLGGTPNESHPEVVLADLLRAAATCRSSTSHA